MIAVAPHHRFVQPLLASYISFGVGCYCFIRTKAMREAKEMGETNIVPTPFFFICFLLGIGWRIINTSIKNHKDMMKRKLSKDDRLMILFFIKKILKKMKTPDGGIDYIEKVAWKFKLEHSLTDNLNESILCLMLEDSDDDIKSLVSHFIKDILNQESLDNNEVWEYLDHIGIKIEKSDLDKKKDIDFKSFIYEDLDSILSHYAYQERELIRKWESENQNTEKNNDLPAVSKHEEIALTEIKQKEIQAPKIKEGENIDYIVISPENRSVNNEILFKDI